MLQINSNNNNNEASNGNKAGNVDDGNKADNADDDAKDNADDVLTSISFMYQSANYSNPDRTDNEDDYNAADNVALLFGSHVCQPTNNNIKNATNKDNFNDDDGFANGDTAKNDDSSTPWSLFIISSLSRYVSTKTSDKYNTLMKSAPHLHADLQMLMMMIIVLTMLLMMIMAFPPLHTNIL